MIDSSESGTRDNSTDEKGKSRSVSVVAAAPATVLLVSNDDVLRARTRAFLQSQGLVAFTSADALCVSEIAFCGHDVSVFVFDLDSLGSVRGMELATELSNGHPGTPLIMLVGDQVPIEVFPTIHRRRWKALLKPVPLTILLGVVRRVLRRRRQPHRPKSNSRLRRMAELVPFPPTVPYTRPPTSSCREEGALTLVCRKGEV